MQHVRTPHIQCNNSMRSFFIADILSSDRGGAARSETQLSASSVSQFEGVPRNFHRTLGSAIGIPAALDYRSFSPISVRVEDHNSRSGSILSPLNVITSARAPLIDSQVRDRRSVKRPQKAHQQISTTNRSHGYTRQRRGPLQVEVSPNDPPMSTNQTSSSVSRGAGEEDKKKEKGNREKEDSRVSVSSALNSLIQMTTSVMSKLDHERHTSPTSFDPSLLAFYSSHGQLKKRRKTRTAFTNQQITELEHRFSLQKYLTPGDRDQISLQLGLSNAQVITWFQNRRAKMKRETEERKNDILAAKRISSGSGGVVTGYDSDSSAERDGGAVDLSLGTPVATHDIESVVGDEEEDDAMAPSLDREEGGTLMATNQGDSGLSSVSSPAPPRLSVSEDQDDQQQPMMNAEETGPIVADVVHRRTSCPSIPSPGVRKEPI